MKINKRSSVSAGEGLSTSETYSQNAIAYCQRSGRAPLVIRNDQAEWSRWMQFLDHIGHNHARPNSYAQKAGSLTVPCQSPDQFEPGWASQEKAEFQPFAPPQANHQRWLDTIPDYERDESRKRMAALWADVRKSIAHVTLQEKYGSKANYSFSEAAE